MSEYVEQFKKFQDIELAAFEELPNSEKDAKKKKKKDMKGSAVRNRFYKIMDDYHSGNEIKRQDALGEAMKELEGLIHLIIKRSYSTYTSKYYYDLVQEGYIGVAVGMEKYNPDISMPSTFFYPYIQHEMQEFISKNVDKATSYMSVNLKKVNQTIVMFENQGIRYSNVDIAIQTGLSIEVIDNILKHRKCTDEVALDGGNLNAIEGEIDHSQFATPEQEYINKEVSSVLLKAVDTVLTKEEAQIIKMSFGLDGDEPQFEIGISKQLRIPKERVKLLLNRGLRKLRQSDLKEYFPDVNQEDEFELISVANGDLSQTDIDFLERIELLDYLD